MAAGCVKARCGPSPSAGEAGKEVTKTGPLDRVVDRRALRGACEGFELRDFGRRAGLDKPP
jgi:hypothetical protein